MKQQPGAFEEQDRELADNVPMSLSGSALSPPTSVLPSWIHTTAINVLTELLN